MPTIDINKKNLEDKTTIYGRLFYHSNLEYYNKKDNDYKPKEKLNLILDYDELYEKSKIDRNSP